MSSTEKKPRLGASKYRKRSEAIVALIKSVSVVEASRTSGIAYSSLIRWMKDPEFQAELQAVKRQYLSAAVGELEITAVSAVRALRRVLEVPHASNMEIVASARALLEFCERYSTAENLETRIAKLEQQAGKTYYDEQPQSIVEARTEPRTSSESGWTRSIANLDSRGPSNDNEGQSVEICNSGGDKPEQPGTSFDFVSDSSTGAQEQAVLATKLPVLIS